MSHTQVYFLSLAVACALGLAVVWYLTSNLRGILIELCGTEKRADFWIAFSNVVLILMPPVFAMESLGDASERLPVVLQLNHQLKAALIGLILSVVCIGVILAQFIRRDATKARS